MTQAVIYYSINRYSIMKEATAGYRVAFKDLGMFKEHLHAVLPADARVCCHISGSGQPVRVSVAVPFGERGSLEAVAECPLVS
jgi:hypothetical protein